MFALGKDDKVFFFAEPEEPEVDVYCVVLSQSHCFLLSRGIKSLLPNGSSLLPVVTVPKGTMIAVLKNQGH